MKLEWNQIIVSLLIGVCLGFAVSTARQMRRFHHLPDRAEMHRRMLHHFTHRLGLSDEQKQKVAAILEEKRKRMEPLFAEMRPKFEEIRKSTREEINKVLTPDQQKKYDVLDAEMMARWNQR